MSAQQRSVPIPSFVCTLLAPLAVFALGTGPQVDTPAQAPTAIEWALTERTCSATDTPTAVVDARQQCLSAQLVSLRAAFGRDLSRLSGADRRRIDAACNRLRTAERPEIYLDCLSGQLAVLRTRQTRGSPARSADAAAAPSPALAPAVVPLPPAPQKSSWPSPILIGGTLGSVLAAAGVALLAVKSRRPRRTCRVCGVDLPDSDLCPTCRHEAAETLRRAAGELALAQKAQEEDARRHIAVEAEQRAQTARDDEEGRLREHALARPQPTEEDDHSGSPVADIPIVPALEDEEADGVFDPYIVLGLPREAGQDDIRVAYQQARARYDPDLVSYLGDAAQAHFRAKAQLVERAYEMLAD
jgi:DnaJ-domain-containing protein 1